MFLSRRSLLALLGGLQHVLACGSGAAEVRTGLRTLLHPLQSEEPQHEEKSCTKQNKTNFNQNDMKVF